jgi:hypothetical protein
MNRLAKIRNKVTEPLASTRKIEEPQVNDDYLTREEGENRHNKNTKEELDIKHIKPDLNAKMKEELKKHKEEQLILLKEYK